MVRVTEGSSFSTGLLSIPSIAWLRILWLRLETFSTFAEGKGAEEGKEDRGEVRRVILIGGVSGDVLLKRSQVVSVLVLKAEKHPGYETVVSTHCTHCFLPRVRLLSRTRFYISAGRTFLFQSTPFASWRWGGETFIRTIRVFYCKSLLLIALFNYLPENSFVIHSVIFQLREYRQSPFQSRSIRA